MSQCIAYSTQEGGVVLVIPTGELSIEEVIAKDIPPGVQTEIINVSDVPSDRTFRNAWVKNGSKIEHDLSKCKTIAHEKRRSARAAEFAPLDIKVTIPAEAASAEAARQAIREKYATLQTQMDAAQNVEELKRLLP